MRHASEDAELLDLVRRYVTPDHRYRKLSGSLLRLEGGEYDRLPRALAEDAELVSTRELGILLEGGWRERRTAAWLIAISGRTEFRERLGELLLPSEVCCAGSAYCVALATFGTPDDADLLATYLDRYLRRPDLTYDQIMVMGALVFVDLNLGGDQASRLLGSGGLWHQWLQDASHMQSTEDPATYLSLVRRLCAFFLRSAPNYVPGDDHRQRLGDVEIQRPFDCDPGRMPSCEPCTVRPRGQ
ncbi:hypothetical protein QF037_009333 [Streptomyces canus]|uniref:DUF6000 family protein n=1 Tax=Streptomyces canus TaxID=58343 RepID=UPI00277F2E3F|nr:DUF6000 family protein [Streptomyces canus]MDQ0604988.1 hypothetical protein [Streptomyces canus]